MDQNAFRGRGLIDVADAVDDRSDRDGRRSVLRDLRGDDPGLVDVDRDGRHSDLHAHDVDSVDVDPDDDGADGDDELVVAADKKMFDSEK